MTDTAEHPDPAGHRDPVDPAAAPEAPQVPEVSVAPAASVAPVDLVAPADEPPPEEIAADLATVVGRLARRLRTASPESLLSPTQRAVLARLGRDGAATTAALARAEFVRPQSMRLTLAALEERGFVERTPDPADGRQSVMSVTPSGRRTLEAVRAAKHGWLSGAIADALDPDERRTLAAAATLLERLADR